MWSLKVLSYCLKAFIGVWKSNNQSFSGILVYLIFYLIVMLVENT